jgi:hypothetical protein
MLTPGGPQSVRDQQQTLPTTQNLGLQASSSAQTQELPASAQRPVGTVVFQSATAGHHAEQQLLESQSAGDVELSPSAASAAVERRRRSAQGQLLQSRGAGQQQRPQRTLSLR